MISETSRILDNIHPKNLEIWKEKDDLEGELKCVRKEKYIVVVHTKNTNRQYENAQARVSEMESDQIKLQGRIDDLTSDLVISRESANKIKKNWTKTSIFKRNLENMHKH